MSEDQKIPGETKEESALNAAEAMLDVDRLLSEEDPEFLKEIEQIQIDAAIVSLSIMDEAMAMIEDRPSRFNFILKPLKNMTNIRANPKKVFLIWTLIFVSISVVYFASFLLNRIFDDKLFLKSYAELGGEVQSYNPFTEAEMLYDNPKFAKNVVTMAKMMANVKASDDSSTNPMLSIELNVEGTSAEATIELKDREAEFKDILLRQTEEFTYNQLETTEGKRELLEKFKSQLNANLTQGQVRRVLLRSFILKP